MAPVLKALWVLGRRASIIPWYGGANVDMSTNARFPVDLQVHTTCSDGTMTPTEVVALAARVGVEVLAITDHDSIDGVEEALEAGRRYGVTVIPAVELSLRHEPERDFYDLDLLGYWIDHRDPDLVAAIRQVQEGRLAQKRAQVERLQALGYRITWEEVAALARGVPGRPHIAEVLRRHHPDEFPTTEAVFATLLRSDGAAYVPRPFALRLEEAARLIRQAGGVPVLAHPGLYTDVRDLEGMIERARRLGVWGLEVWYPYYKTRVCDGCSEAESARLCRRFERLADRLGMVKTGGSDFHGDRKDVALGEQGLTWEQFEALIAAVAGFIRERGPSKPVHL